MGKTKFILVDQWETDTSRVCARALNARMVVGMYADTRQKMFSSSPMHYIVGSGTRTVVLTGVPKHEAPPGACSIFCACEWDSLDDSECAEVPETPPIAQDGHFFEVIHSYTREITCISLSRSLSRSNARSRSRSLTNAHNRESRACWAQVWATLRAY